MSFKATIQYPSKSDPRYVRTFISPSTLFGIIQMFVNIGHLVYPNSNCHFINDKLSGHLGTFSESIHSITHQHTNYCDWLVVCTVYSHYHTERSPLPSLPPHVCMSVCCIRPGHWRTNCSYKRQPTPNTGIGWMYILNQERIKN